MTLKNWKSRAALVSIAVGTFHSQATGQNAQTQSASLGPVVVSETFENLDQWRTLEFPFTRNSQYDILPQGYLRAHANQSVSAIIWNNEFRPASAPLLSWRWNIANVLPNGNAHSEDGDDFPIRVSVCFRFIPSEAKEGERAWFEMKRVFYGEYPPYRVMHYVFANRSDLDQRYIQCPYSERARIVVQRAGEENVNRWFEEQVNILEDYRAAFGEEPPSEATISIMADADNTDGASTAFVDWIQVSKVDGP